MPKDTELTVAIEGDELVVKIGLSTLAHAARTGPYFDDIYGQTGKETVVTDEGAFAKGILSELLQEDEEGTTLVHQMLDKAAERAVENGCEGIEIPEPPPRDPPDSQLSLLGR